MRLFIEVNAYQDDAMLKQVLSIAFNLDSNSTAWFWLRTLLADQVMETLSAEATEGEDEQGGTPCLNQQSSG